LVPIAALMACSLETSGIDRPGEPDLGARGSTGEPGEPFPTTGLEEGGHLSDGPPTGGAGPSDPDTGTDAFATESGGSTDADPGTSTGDTVGDEPPEQAHLQNVAFADCGSHVWCWNSLVDEPSGGPFWIQECFQSTVAPPYRVASIDVVPNLVPEALEPVQLQVRALDSMGRPGETLWYGAVNDAASLEAGVPNTITFDEQPLVNASGFCVGFYIEATGWGGALGMGVDVGTQVLGASWLAGCGIGVFDDLISLAIEPGGNWCMAADVASTSL
jgi:hypothetical protein